MNLQLSDKMIQPIWKKRGLLADHTLVIADLHIGYEKELENKGVRLPSQTVDMIDSVVEILREEDIDKLVINGDFKHNIPESTWQEYSEIPEAIDGWLKEVDEIHLIPGNHDGGIDRYLPSDVSIHDPSGWVDDGVGFFHGHAWPSEEVLETGHVIVGHNHPMVTLTDSLGNKEKKQCWIRGKFQLNSYSGKFIMMPHLNPLLGGISVNEDGFLGPFLKNAEMSEEKVYLLDGTKLGSIDLGSSEL